VSRATCRIHRDAQVNSLDEDPHDATGRFEFALVNPPFNVNTVDKERSKDMVGPARRFPFGLSRTRPIGSGFNSAAFRSVPRARYRIGSVARGPILPGRDRLTISPERDNSRRSGEMLQASPATRSTRVLGGTPTWRNW
jgi:hypothetical protein